MLLVLAAKTRYHLSGCSASQQVGDLAAAKSSREHGERMGGPHQELRDGTSISSGQEGRGHFLEREDEVGKA